MGWVQGVSGFRPTWQFLQKDGLRNPRIYKGHKQHMGFSYFGICRYSLGKTTSPEEALTQASKLIQHLLEVSPVCVIYFLRPYPIAPVNPGSVKDENSKTSKMKPLGFRVRA